jgi:hypothetical protein
VVSWDGCVGWRLSREAGCSSVDFALGRKNVAI